MVLGLFISCEDNSSKIKTSTEIVEEEPTQEEMAAKTEKLLAQLIKPEDVGLQGNVGGKWMINPETYKQLMQIKQQIYAISGYMDTYEIGRFNEIGNEILSFVEIIPVSEDENIDEELQKIIKMTKNQCLHLVESDLQNAQVAVINLSILYDEVPQYFIAKK
jgi:hypothetical protein